MGFSLAVAESLTLSSTVAGALGGGGVTSTVSAEAVSARAVVGTGSEGGLLAGGTEVKWALGSITTNKASGGDVSS